LKKGGPDTLNLQTLERPRVRLCGEGRGTGVHQKERGRGPLSVFRSAERKKLYSYTEKESRRTRGEEGLPGKENVMIFLRIQPLEEKGRETGA